VKVEFNLTSDWSIIPPQ